MNKLIKKFQRDWLFWRSFSLKKAAKTFQFVCDEFSIPSHSNLLYTKSLETSSMENAWLLSYRFYQLSQYANMLQKNCKWRNTCQKKYQKQWSMIYVTIYLHNLPFFSQKVFHESKVPVRLNWCNWWYAIAASFADILAWSLVSQLLFRNFIPPAAEASHVPIHSLWRRWRTDCQIRPQATSSLETGSGRFRALRQISKWRDAEIMSPYRQRDQRWLCWFLTLEQNMWG